MLLGALPTWPHSRGLLPEWRTGLGSGYFGVLAFIRQDFVSTGQSGGERLGVSQGRLPRPLNIRMANMGKTPDSAGKLIELLLWYE
jgi:hypothetical protein